MSELPELTYPPERYHGDEGEVTAHLRPASTPGDLPADATNPMDYLATGASTDGQFGLYRGYYPPTGKGPGPHFHKTITESFYILSGTMSLYDGTRWVDASQGDFLYVPQGGLHGFRNSSDEPAAMLLLFTPGAPREEYFETLVEVATGRATMTEQERHAFMIRHDTYWK